MASSLSAYEVQRAANIKANNARLVELGIVEDVAAIRSAQRTQRAVKGSAVNKRAKPEAVPPRSRSLRLQNLDSEGNAIPDKPVLPSPTPEHQPKRMRKSSAPLDAAKISTGATSADEASAFLSRLGPLLGSAATATPSAKTRAKSPVSTKKQKPATSMPTSAAPTLSLDLLSSLSVAEDDIAKLVPERIFSLEVHPSPSKLLIAAGDTWGRVGLWDVEAGDDAPVATFEPHSRPVAGIRVLSERPHQLLSASHDGAVRCLDLSAGTSFVELYRAPEDADGDYPSLHGLSRTAGAGGALAVSRSDGAVVMLDPRVPSAAGASIVRLHEKKVFSADFSPAKPWLLATSSLDRTVALWDIRMFSGSGGDSKKPKPKALTTLEHGLSVTAARFSQNGTKLLTTCNDDLLRVFSCGGSVGADSVGKWSLSQSIKHNNKTGRYLTPFQAEWVRGSDESFVCGSMGQPRGVDVFNCDGSDADRLDESESVTAVVSLLAFHPTMPVLVGSNASGKAYIWRA